MLDITHLDEVRIIKTLDSPCRFDNSAKSSLIIQDFSMLDYGKIDILHELRKALGANIEFEATRLIFVEGIMDDNILNGYGEPYDYQDSRKLLFLPISELGSKNDKTETSDNKVKELQFSNEQKQKTENLIAFAKLLRIHPVLLVDNDEAGQAMKKGVESNFQQKLSVVTLKEVFEKANGDIRNKVYAIESLFNEKDREKFGFDVCKANKQVDIVSSVFKNTENLKDKLSQKSKTNFNTLFKFLVEFMNRLNKK